MVKFSIPMNFLKKRDKIINEKNVFLFLFKITRKIFFFKIINS